MALQTASTASGKKMKGECHRESSAVPPGTPRRTPVATPRGSNAVDPAVARPGRKNVATARLIFNTIFFLPLTAWSLASKTRASVATICCTTTAGARSVASSLSGTLEFMVIKKLFDGFYELFSGVFELGALVFCFSLIFWVSGLFLGLAVCSMFVACACCYVLLCAVGMNWCLDRIRVYLRDCLVLRMCSVCIPMVSVLRGLRFTAGVTVHFPDKSMVWILHAGHWVVRLCWRHCFDPMTWINGAHAMGDNSCNTASISPASPSATPPSKCLLRAAYNTDEEPQMVSSY